METNIVPLHSFLQYEQECAEILNDEWKRSLTARLHTLRKSRDAFPINLVLLEKTSQDMPMVIGHSRLSVIQGQATKSCLVESVCVRRSLRGKGYGKIIMEKTEQFAASKGYETMYLTTHDKQKFYEHLGYNYCSSVVSIGTDILPEHLAEKLMKNLGVKNEDTSVPQNTSAIGTKTCEKHCDTGTQDCQTNSVNVHEGVRAHDNNCQLNSLTIKGGVSKPVAPPPPPCPVAPPPPAMNADISKSDISRFDPRNVSWMKKDLKML